MPRTTLNDFALRQKGGDDESWEDAQKYEVAHQLARIAQALEAILDEVIYVRPRKAK